MIFSNIEKQILFLGPYSKQPKGGVASVMAEYKKIYPKAYFVSSTNSKNKLTKICGVIWGIINFLFLLSTRPHIKIIHIHGASYSSFYRKFLFFRISRFFGKKVIYHIHGGKYHIFFKNAKSIERQLIQNFINHSECIICLSHSWKIFFESQFSPKRLSIIPNIIEEPKLFKKLSKYQSAKNFLFLGSISTNKGIWLLLDVLREHITEIDGKAVFHIGGNGETKKLKNLIQEYDLNDVVKFIGWVNGEFKHDQLSSADVYIQPSYNEGLPISILEAMSYSLPILSTTVGGIPEVVTQKNGILCEPGNKEELWRAIKFFIYADNSSLSKMGEESFLMVQPHLPEAVHKRLNYLYNSLMIKDEKHSK